MISEKDLMQQFNYHVEYLYEIQNIEEIIERYFLLKNELFNCVKIRMNRRYQNFNGKKFTPNELENNIKLYIRQRNLKSLLK